MRIIVFSDTHGNMYATKEIFDNNKDCDTFIFLGDGLKELNEVKKLYPKKNVYAVHGNCDYSTEYPAVSSIKVDGVTIIFSHGHEYGVKYDVETFLSVAEDNSSTIALFGHSHCRFSGFERGIYLFNPGSASLPRDGKPPSYGYIDITDAGIVCGHKDVKKKLKHHFF